MPLYSFKCDECGHAEDILMSMSAVPPTECPKCGKPAFKKVLSTASFEFKGNGFYVTDFKNKK